MLRLKPPGDASWEDMGGGVRMLIRPGTSIHENGARALASAKIAEALKGVEILAEFGVVMEAEKLSSRRGMLLGLSELLVSIELGVLLIEEWEGIGDESGEPVAVSRAWITQLFLLQPDIRATFWQKAFAGRHQEEAEGNVFAPLPTGLPAGAPNTASAAARTGSPARTATGSKARKTRKKGGSAR